MAEKKQTGDVHRMSRVKLGGMGRMDGLARDLLLLSGIDEAGMVTLRHAGRQLLLLLLDSHRVHLMLRCAVLQNP